MTRGLKRTVTRTWLSDGVSVDMPISKALDVLAAKFPMVGRSVLTRRLERGDVRTRVAVYRLANEHEENTDGQ